LGRGKIEGHFFSDEELGHFFKLCLQIVGTGD
jgi:hypothetical protein